MKVNAKIVGLLVALAAGTAGAVGTAAGTPIENKATASFEIPNTTGGTDPGTAESNTVTTTVLAKPGFDIQYAGGQTDGGGTASSPANSVSQDTPVLFTDQKPGSVVTSTYKLINYGNVELTVALSSLTSGNPTSVTYTYTDSKGTKTDVTSGNVVVPADGEVTITQKVTVPSGAAANSFVGATPVGSVVGTGTEAGQNGIPSGQTLYEGQEVSNAGAITSTPAQNTDLQYTAIKVYEPKVKTEPPPAPNPDPKGPGTPANPGTVVVPPQNPGKPIDPNNPGTGTPDDPVSPDDTPQDPNVPTSTGYKDGTTVIAISGNEQHAYPTAGTTSVTFTNVITNNGSLSDTVTLIAPTGLPTGVSVSFPGTDADPNTPGFQVTVPAGQTVSYQVEVTFPDNSTSATNLSAISVEIGIDSGNDGADTAADSKTTDVIHPPAFRFGDDNGTGPGATANQTADLVTQVVIPGSRTATNILNNTSDNVAVFPMNLENTGDYNESYTLSATTSVPNATVVYLDSAGNELPKNTAGKYLSPVVGKGTEIKVYAVVVVPSGTDFGTYTLNQTATANYSGQVATDTNDVIKVGADGKIVVGKFTAVRDTLAADDHHVDGSSATATAAAGAPATSQQIGNPANYSAMSGANVNYRPGESYSYQIIGKNTYNATIKNFVLTDVVANTLTVGTPTCTVSTGATCTVTMNGNTVTTSAVELTKGATVTLIIPVTVK